MSIADRVLGSPWLHHDEPGLTRETLDALFANQIPCIRIKGFATADECRAFVAAMDAIGLNKEYQVASPSVRALPKYIGVPQFEYRKKSKAAYFAEVEPSFADQAKVFAHCGFDPIQRLIDRVHAVVPERPIGLAREPDHGSYYAGIIRETTGGTNLHMDFAASARQITRSVRTARRSRPISMPAARRPAAKRRCTTIISNRRYRPERTTRSRRSTRSAWQRAKATPLCRSPATS